MLSFLGSTGVDLRGIDPNLTFQLAITLDPADFEAATQFFWRRPRVTSPHLPVAEIVQATTAILVISYNVQKIVSIASLLEIVEE